MLLIPTILIAVVLEPGVSYTTLLLVAMTAGVGGGNFASSMTNINHYYPARLKGWALGVNAGGNLGVPVVQLVGASWSSRRSGPTPARARRDLHPAHRPVRGGRRADDEQPQPGQQRQGRRP
jgi:hypothetical protein